MPTCWKEANVRKDPVMKDVIDSYDLLFSDERKFLNYVNRRMAIMDYRSGLESAYERGYEKGYKKGLALGKAMRAKAILDGLPSCTVKDHSAEKNNEDVIVIVFKTGVSADGAIKLLKSINVSKEEVAAVLDKYPELKGGLQSESGSLEH